MQIQRPLHKNTFGLILPCSHIAKEGIFVIPGVTDFDHTGTVYIQVWSHMPLSLPKGSSIAQLIVIPYISAQQPLNERGNAGFSSTVIGACLPISLVDLN